MTQALRPLTNIHNLVEIEKNKHDGDSGVSDVLPL